MSNRTGNSNVRVSIGKDGSKNITIGGTYTRSNHHSMPPNFNMAFQGMTGNPMYTKKVVDSKFNIKNSTVDNLAVGNTGKTVVKSTQEVFEEGSTKKDFNITGGKFTGSVIGGKGIFKNKDSTIASGGVEVKEWDYDVEATLLTVLKQGVSTSDLLMALQKGGTLKMLQEVFEGKSPEQRKIFMDSILFSQDADMES